MKKRVIAFVLTIVIIVSTLFAASYSAFADDVTWSYNSATKTLTISGEGDMDDYIDEYSTPWHNYIISVENLVVEDGVTSVGARSLAGASALVNVTLAESVTSINDYAFSSCSNLNELTFGSEVTNIADSSFAYDGTSVKNNFTLNCNAGSYALYYAVKNDINFSCDSVKCGDYVATIKPKGMWAYYPYTAKVNGTFKFYSSGNHDTYGYLYDSDFNLLKSNDDASSSNTNFSIEYKLTKGETYYVAAKIYNSSLTGKFNFSIEPVSYSVSGTIFAMNDPSGAPSDIVVTDALIDGMQTNGTFEYTITQPTTIAIKVGNQSREYTFDPDNTDDCAISIITCDINNDKVVNGKDYAQMLKTDSPYIDLFKNFANYKL